MATYVPDDQRATVSKQIICNSSFFHIFFFLAKYDPKEKRNNFSRLKTKLIRFNKILFLEL